MKMIKNYLSKVYRSLSRKTYVFGDSHTEVFQYISEKRLILFQSYDVTLVGGATAQGLRNPNSKTDCLNIFKRKIEKLPLDAKLIFMLGEVDTGFVIWYRAQKYNENVENQLTLSLECYFQFLENLKKQGYKNICVISTPLPTIEDNQDWGEIANLRKSITATKKQRTELTLKYNALLEKKCEQNAFTYVGTDDVLLDRNTHVIHNFFMNKDRNNHHLDLEMYSKVMVNKLKKQN